MSCAWRIREFTYLLAEPDVLVDEAADFVPGHILNETLLAGSWRARALQLHSVVWMLQLGDC